MRKGAIIGIILLIGIILAVIAGIYTFNKNNVSDIKKVESKRLAENGDNTLNEIVETSSVENERISPNAIVIEKKYYKICDHLIRNVVDISEDLVNKTRDELQEKYLDWKVEGFSPKEIVVYKEFDEMCGEHYLIKEHNGVIGIYTLDKYEKPKLKEDTEIETKYLPEEDLEELKVGIKIIGKTNLYEFIENFE